MSHLDSGQSVGSFSLITLSPTSHFHQPFLGLRVPGQRHLTSLPNLFSLCFSVHVDFFCILFGTNWVRGGGIAIAVGCDNSALTVLACR